MAVSARRFGAERLALYDIAGGRTVTIGAGVVTAQEHGGMLWLSTGPQDSPTWYALDLRALI